MTIPTGIRAYLLRPGTSETTGLTRRGRADVQEAAEALRTLTAQGWPHPKYIAASDLPRARQTADIAATVLGLPKPRPMPRLNAFDKRESKYRYVQRTTAILGALISDTQLPLIVTHRSTTAYLGLQYGLGPAQFDQGLLEPGGILAITGNDLWPLHRIISTAWPLADRAYDPAYDSADFDESAKWAVRP